MDFQFIMIDEKAQIVFFIISGTVIIFTVSILVAFFWKRKIKYRDFELGSDGIGQNSVSFEALDMILMKRCEIDTAIRKLWSKDILREQKKEIRRALQKILYSTFTNIEKLCKDQEQINNYDNYQHRIYKHIAKMTDDRLEENHLADKTGEDWNDYIEDITIQVLKFLQETYRDKCPKYFKDKKFSAIQDQIPIDVKNEIKKALDDCREISIKRKVEIKKLEDEFLEFKNKYIGKNNNEIS